MYPVKFTPLVAEVADTAISSLNLSRESASAARLLEDSRFSKIPLDLGKLADQFGLGSVLGAKRLTGGVVNDVFRVSTTGESFIARFSPDSLRVYQKEEWAMNRVATAGVRTPRVFGVGEDKNLSYMFLEDMGGRTLADMTGDRSLALEKLGKQIALTNSIKVKGFGFWVDLSDPEKPFFTESWRAMRAAENKFIFDGEPLVKLGALTSRENQEAKKFLQPMINWNYEPRLCHGDVNLNNAILRDNGEVAVIDWTQVKGGVAPFFDLANLSAKIPTEFPSFLKGYGLSPRQYASRIDSYQRVLLTDSLRAGSWAQQTSHPEAHKFVADIRSAYESIVGR
ncbi:MAG TPA: aminoglycoside phosphotransferase family protein [Drouetiella sp.]|jgi:aminoglycoside phosphotransferase (APT) family kinase protein